MPLPPVPPGGPGGLLQCEYSNAASGDRHQSILHLCWFNQNPSGPDNDYAYTGGGPISPSETSVLQTFAAYAALWSAYYSPAWTLAIRALLWQQEEDEVVLPLTPLHAPVAGSNTAVLPQEMSTTRIFHLRSVQRVRRRLWLIQVPDSAVGDTVEVSPSSGGFDGRDRSLMAYLAGASGGAVVAPDGHRFEPVCDVRRWYARSVESASTSGGGRDNFIGPTPPADPQDGYLWVDTGGGSDLILNVYSAMTGEWIAVGPGAPYLVGG